jgi:hypothetical protein
MAGSRVIAERAGRGMLVTRLSSFGDLATLGGTPKQVAFDSQKRPLQLAGRAPESGVDTYVVAAGPREVVDARIDGFPLGTLELRAARNETGYRVDIVRRAEYCQPPTIPYILTLTLKR